MNAKRAKKLGELIVRFGSEEAIESIGKLLMPLIRKAIWLHHSHPAIEDARSQILPHRRQFSPFRTAEIAIAEMGSYGQESIHMSQEWR